MSYPNPPPPPHPFFPLPFPGGDLAGFWPPFLMENEQPDLIFQAFDRPPPFKRLRNSEILPKFSSLPPINPRTNPSNVPGSKNTGYMFYKTRICAKFMEGTCKNGDRCTFAHGAKDLREPPSNWQEIVKEKDRKGGAGSSSSSEDQRMSHWMKSCYNKNGEEFTNKGKRELVHERSSPMQFGKSKVDDGSNQRESSAISIGTTSDGRGRRGFDSYDHFNSKFKNRVGDSLEDYRVKTGPWRGKRGHGAFGERSHFARGHSGTRVDGPPVIESSSARARPTSVSVYSKAPKNLVFGGQVREDTGASKWKLKKKINRIYADWLDDRTPPFCSPTKDYA